MWSVPHMSLQKASPCSATANSYMWVSGVVLCKQCEFPLSLTSSSSVPIWGKRQARHPSDARLFVPGPSYAKNGWHRWKSCSRLKLLKFNVHLQGFFLALWVCDLSFQHGIGNEKKSSLGWQILIGTCEKKFKALFKVHITKMNRGIGCGFSRGLAIFTYNLVWQ